MICTIAVLTSIQASSPELIKEIGVGGASDTAGGAGDDA